MVRLPHDAGLCERRGYGLWLAEYRNTPRRRSGAIAQGVAGAQRPLPPGSRGRITRVPRPPVDPFGEHEQRCPFAFKLGPHNRVQLQHQRNLNRADLPTKLASVHELRSANDPHSMKQADLITSGLSANGNDTLLGMRDADTLNGGAGDDWIDGGTQDDSISGWTGDDELYVVDNPFIESLDPASVGELFVPGGPASLYVVNYAPLHLLAHGLQRFLFGPWMEPYHVTNVLLHALAGLLLVALLVAQAFRPGTVPLGTARLVAIVAALAPDFPHLHGYLVLEGLKVACISFYEGNVVACTHLAQEQRGPPVNAGLGKQCAAWLDDAGDGRDRSHAGCKQPAVFSPFKSGDQFFGLLEKRIVVTAVDMTRVDQLIGFVTHECGSSLYRRHDGACCRIKTATTMGQQAVEV